MRLGLGALLVVLSALASSCAGEIEELQVPDESMDDPVVGGHVETGYPAVGYLLWWGQPLCTGTLIGKDAFLTSAHCVALDRDDPQAVNPRPEDLRVGFGPKACQGETCATTYGVRSYTAHASYASGTEHDLAVVRLTRPVENIVPAVITTPKRYYFDFKCKKYMDIGYGMTKWSYLPDGGVVESEPGLRKGLEECIWSLDPLTIIAHSPNGQTCHGDSGGPLMETNTNHLVGVLHGGGSTPYMCAPSKTATSSFARPDADKAFIDGAMANPACDTSAVCQSAVLESGAPCLNSTGGTSYCCRRGEVLFKGRCVAPVCAATPAADHWKGTYFDNMQLSGNPIAQIDEGGGYLEKTWDQPGSTCHLPSYAFSASFVRQLALPDYQRLRFHLFADDGVRLSLDGKVLADAWQGYAGNVATADLEVSPGAHALKADFRQDQGLSRLALSWEMLPACRRPLTSVPANHWRGEYFPNISLSGTASLVRDDGEDLTMRWGDQGPDMSGCMPAADMFSARWTRNVPLAAGNVRLHVVSDDGFRVWIDNQLVMDHWMVQGSTPWDQDVSVAAGSRQLRIEYFEQSGLANLEFALQALPTPTCSEVGTGLYCDYSPGLGKTYCSVSTLSWYCACPPGQRLVDQRCQ